MGESLTSCHSIMFMRNEHEMATIDILFKDMTILYDYIALQFKLKWPCRQALSEYLRHGNLRKSKVRRNLDLLVYPGLFLV